MINIRYYAKLLLSEGDANLVIRLYKTKEFDNLNKAQWFFMNQDATSVLWVKETYYREKLPTILKDFAKKLESEQLGFEEKVELVLEKCHWSDELFDFLEVKGSSNSQSVLCVCPKCKKTKHSAWIPDKGNSKLIKCNHRSSCGFCSNYIGAYAEEFDLTYGQALSVLANVLDVNFTIKEIHKDDTKKVVEKKQKIALKPKEVKQLEYMVFDPKKKYHNLKLEDFEEKYDSMTEVQQFKMLATAIFRFSLKTDQAAKEKYFENIGVSMSKNPILREKIAMINSNLGYLDKTDIPELIKFLTPIFGTDNLIKFGVIHAVLKYDNTPHPFALSFKQSVEEGLIVIPNFDMYTSMCTGLKYRKTKLKEYYDKKLKKKVRDLIKEPEFSYGRIARPLPYHLTRRALLKRNITFRFFEGQKDLHSIPLKKNVCDIAIPGINGISEEMLGLFNERLIELYFDQDEAGQKATYGYWKFSLSDGTIREIIDKKVLIAELEAKFQCKGYKTVGLIEKLEKAGAIVVNKTWDIQLGSDVNEVLQNGNISKIILQ